QALIRNGAAADHFRPLDEIYAELDATGAPPPRERSGSSTTPNPTPKTWVAPSRTLFLPQQLAFTPPNQRPQRREPSRSLLLAAGLLLTLAVYLTWHSTRAKPADEAGSRAMMAPPLPSTIAASSPPTMRLPDALPSIAPVPSDPAPVAAPPPT